MLHWMVIVSYSMFAFIPKSLFFLFLFFPCLRASSHVGMDILVPRIGEIIGGSVREDDYELLKGRAAEVGISEEQLSW